MASWPMSETFLLAMERTEFGACLRDGCSVMFYAGFGFSGGCSTFALGAVVDLKNVDFFNVEILGKIIRIQKSIIRSCLYE